MATSSSKGMLSGQERKRSWHSKSRAGCQTCKKRRIKCDETKPQCRRCLSGGRDCGGYAPNPKPWLFPDGKPSDMDPVLYHPGFPGSLDNDSAGPENPGALPRNLLKLPYQTREDHLALEFWLKMTSPDSTDPPLNALHSVFGSYLPQAAWHHESVRHGLISAASTALSLEDKSGNPELSAAMLKQSVLQMQLAIQTLLKEKEIGISTVITSLMITFICGWSGKWDDYCIHLRSCLGLIREVKALGQEPINSDLLTCIEHMVASTASLPPAAGKSQSDRLAYAHSVILVAKQWLDTVIANFERRHVSDTLQLALRYHRARINWILLHWKSLFPTARKHLEVQVETSPYAAALHNIQDDAFSLPLLTMQLSLALRSTLLYAAQEDPTLLRDTAYACHCPGEMVM